MQADEEARPSLGSVVPYYRTDSKVSEYDEPELSKVESTSSSIKKIPSQMPPPPAQPLFEPDQPPTEKRARGAGRGADGDDDLEDGESTVAGSSVNGGEGEFPEGGWRAWAVVFGSWCAMTATFGMVNIVGFLQAKLSQNQLKDYTEAQISWIFSVYIFLFFFGGVQVGPIFDTYGLRFVFIPGCIGSVLSVFFLSLSTEYYQFMLGYGLLGGLSASLVFTPSIAVVGHWFYRRRGLATGIAATGGAVGGLVYPLAMDKMSKTMSFGWTVRVIGFVVLALCIMSVLTIKTRVPPNKSAGASIDIKAFKDLRFLFVTLGTFMMEWGLFVPMTYLSTYALSYGMNQTRAYQLVSFLSLGSIFGRALPGYFADRFGRFNVMIVTSTVCAIFCLALWWPAAGQLGPTVAFAVLFGFWSGTAICLTPVCISQICKTEDYGKRYGTCYFVVSFGVLTGVPIAGEILNRQNGHYWGLILFAGVSYVVGAFFYVLARVAGAGTKVRKIY